MIFDVNLLNPENLVDVLKELKTAYQKLEESNEEVISFFSELDKFNAQPGLSLNS